VIRFEKLQGIGNDFIVVDLLAPDPGCDLSQGPALAKKLCDRKFGIGGDGLIFLTSGEKEPFAMRMFNPDGSESEMCGNGLRCLAQVMRSHGHSSASSVSIETGAGVLQADFLSDGQVRIDMGPARTSRKEIGMAAPSDETFIEQPVGGGFLGTAVSMGNPHLVIFVPSVGAIDLPGLGRQFEHHELFPNRTNVHFIEVIDRNTLKQRTWERGAGATLACGTGACASAVAGFLTGRSERTVEMRLPGGNLRVEYLENCHVLMTGPATLVYEGVTA